MTPRSKPSIPTRAAMASAIALALFGAASPSRAAAVDAIFDAFGAVCGAPAGDFSAVRVAADSHGWGSAEASTDSAMPGVNISERLVRGSNVGGVGLVLSSWHGLAKDNVKVSACTVHVAKSDFEPLKSAAAAWLKFSPAQSDTKKAVFRYTETGGAHSALTPDQYNAAAAAGGLEILTVSADANGTVIDLLVIKK